ncbi:hypothetical protein chiPu_0008448 [Chiloscyllium punctatum]|uniref:Uncharacterized protein n=1 Tax=Chiloscyllium punctatum TaxID=137246 RepID=A0A401SHZ8_CHIPU|nr:hypothetical protein [Chiloscyllium punctatum]
MRDQYKFIYLVLLEALTFGDTSISLKDFGQCMKIMAEKDTYTLSNGFSKEYETLQTFSQLFEFHRHREGLKTCNQIKNRFPNILPGKDQTADLAWSKVSRLSSPPSLPDIAFQPKAEPK